MIPLLVTLHLACVGESTPAPTVTTPVAQAPADPAKAVRDALLAGKYAEALSAGEAALAAHPDQDAVWDLVEVAAIRGAQSGALLDRLSADQAIGGRADRHHALRASLAVDAKRPADVLAAARHLEPGDAASFLLAAARLGAPLPPDAPPAVAAILAAGDPAVPIDPVVDSLGGDRATVARAELRLSRGDRTGAEALLASVSPKGLLLAETVACLKVRSAADPAVAWTTAEAAARVASEAGDLPGAGLILDTALPVAAGAFRADTVAASAAAFRKTAEEAKNSDSAALFASIQADAALRAGQPSVAVEAATAAAGVAATKARGQWALAMGNAMAGDAAGVEAAATGLAGVRVKAVQDLASAMRGGNPQLPSPGIEGGDAALQALLGAGWLLDPTPALTAAAAAAGGTPDLRRWAELWASRAPVSTPEGASAPLQAENAVRQWLAGGTPAAVADPSHPNAPAWAVLAGAAPATPASGAIAAWSALRAKAASGDSEGAAVDLATLAGAVPAWRTGPWAPLLALDGPLPGELTADRAALSALKDRLPVATIQHGWAHQLDARRTMWSRGVDPLAASVAAADRTAIWDAVARERVLTLAWLGGGAWPAEAVSARLAAEAKAGLKSPKPMSLADVRTALDDAAVFSFLPDGDSLELLVLTAGKGDVVRLPATFAASLEAYVAALKAGSVPIASGDRLRSTAIDPVANVVLGVGLYHVVGRPPVGSFPIDALPEQADGLRFLSSIRNISHALSFESLVAGQEFADNMFTLSLVGVLNAPDEASELKLLYPDAKLLTGKEATVKAWRESVATARFLHFGRLPSAAGGGFLLPSGETLHLSDIARTPIMARTVVIAGEGDPAVAAARAGAFRQAGARDVLVTTWVRDPGYHDKLLSRFWERTNRRWAGSRSLSEARIETATELGGSTSSPSFWGGYVLSSAR